MALIFEEPGGIQSNASIQWYAMQIVLIFLVSRFCGGIMDDIKRKSKWYWADFKDAAHIQSIASIIFLYFASMTPLVTFGGLMSTLLKGRMVREKVWFQ